MPKTAPRNFSLDDLAALVNDSSRKFDVLLHKSSEWIDWEVTAAMFKLDARIVKVDPDSQWPLHVTFSGSSRDLQQAPYDPKMEFYCRSR